MLDIKAIRQDPTAIVSGLQKRGHEFPLDRFTSLDAQRKDADIRSQSLLAERKSASKKIGELVGQGVSVDEAKAQVNEILERIAMEIDIATEQARVIQVELDGLLLETPNLPLAAVPEGLSEDDNVEILR